MSDPLGRSSEQYEKYRLYNTAIEETQKRAAEGLVSPKLADRIIELLAEDQHEDWQA